MTNKRHIAALTLILLVGAGLLAPTHVTHASSFWETLIGGSFNLVSYFLMPLAYVVMTFMSLMTYLSGILLNEVVFHTVVNMAENFKELQVIDSTWATIRDLANMGFIFVLLYAAIQMILGSGKNIRQMIVNMVVAALLINFSLFFTKLIIDASNILALMFYNAMAPGSATASAVDVGISNVFVKILGLPSLFSWDAVLAPGNIVTIGVMGSITLAIVSFVFAAIALMFIIRYVALIFVLILSPIAFVAGILPGLGSQAKDWWNTLISQAFFAPIFMLLAWVAASVTTGVARVLKTTNVNWTDALRGTVDANGVAHAGVINIVIVYLIVITFLIASLMIAKSWSGKAGGAIKKLNDWATNTAGSWTLGNAGRFTRGTVGRAAQAVADSEWMKDKASSSMIARLGMATARKAGSTSFDLRANIAGAGKAQKGGFAKDLEEKVKAEKKFADSLKPSDLEVDRAEKALKDAKDKSKGTPADLQDIADAQKRVDDLKGVNEDEARKRARQKMQEEFFENNGRTETMSDRRANAELTKFESIRESNIKEAQRRDPNLTRKEAEEAWKADYDAEVGRLVSTGRDKQSAELEVATRMGWKPETIKGAGNERKTTYEKGNTTTAINGPSFNVPLPGGNKYKVETGFSFTDRVGMVGNLKRERHEESLAIRKSMKEKSKEKKIMEAVEGAAAGGDETPETPAPTTPPPGPATPP